MVTSADLASTRHIISPLMPVISVLCFLLESPLTSVYRLNAREKVGAIRQDY